MVSLTLYYVQFVSKTFKSDRQRVLRICWSCTLIWYEGVTRSIYNKTEGNVCLQDVLNIFFIRTSSLFGVGYNYLQHYLLSQSFLHLILAKRLRSDKSEFFFLKMQSPSFILSEGYTH